MSDDNKSTVARYTVAYPSALQNYQSGAPSENRPISTAWPLNNAFTQIILPVCVLKDGLADTLGTAFAIGEGGLMVTCWHVVKGAVDSLYVAFPRVKSFSEYQDTSDTTGNFYKAVIVEIDSIRDLAILKVELLFPMVLPGIGSLDDVAVGERLVTLGFPHAAETNRVVLTFHSLDVGAKVLLPSGPCSVAKHAVINLLARPGQSGAPVISPTTGAIVGVLIGTYSSAEASAIINGIDPATLNQTSHMVCASYIKDML